MPTELLPVGPIFNMVQNVIYALPTVECVFFTDATTPTVQVSETVAFTANVALVFTAGAAPVTGGFIRCTSGNITASLKRD